MSSLPVPDLDATVPSASGAKAILDEAAAHLRELHGPALASLTVERVVVGVFFTGVMLSDGSAGVAYTPPEMIERASTRILGNSPRLYRGRRADEMMDRSLDGQFAHVVRLAAMNALSVPFLREMNAEFPAGGDLSDMPQLFRGRKVCMVGAIIPLLRKLNNMSASEIVVIDRKKETQAEAGLANFAPAEKAAECLGACQTAVFTGATIANGTIEDLLGWTSKTAAIAVVGPTAGFVPTALFRRGVLVVGTVIVTDGQQALDLISEGGGGLHLFKQCVTKINLVNRQILSSIGLSL